MKTKKIRGLVLKENIVGESNKLITILAKEYGKVILNAKGAKNQKSRLLAGTQLFCYCDFIVFDGKGFQSINQADVIESFYAIRTDLHKLSFGAYLLELIEKTIFEEMESDAALKLLLQTFSLFSKTDYNVKLAVKIFELKYLQLMGFMPEMNKCCICEGALTQEIWFNALSGGIVCSKCRSKGKSVKISSGTYKTMQHILNAENKNLFRFNVSDNVFIELSTIINRYMAVHIGERFRTLDFAERLPD